MQPEITVTAELAERATRNGTDESLATGVCNVRGTIISEDGELEERRRRRNMCSVDCCFGAGWPEFSKKGASTPSRPSSDQKSDEKASIGRRAGSSFSRSCTPRPSVLVIAQLDETSVWNANATITFNFANERFEVRCLPHFGGNS